MGSGAVILFGVAMVLLIGLTVVALYFAGARVPLATTARLCLWEKLRAAGLAGYVDPACVNEIADFHSAGLMLVAQRGGRALRPARRELLRRLDGAVRIIDSHLHAMPPPPDPDARPVLLLLSKYGIAAGAAREAPPGA